MGLMLAVSAGTCEITGKPEMVTDSNIYTITATNAGGSDTATVTILVEAEVADPDLANLGVEVGRVGEEITITFVNSGGAVEEDGCNAGSNSGAGGVGRDSKFGLRYKAFNGTCQIVGTPTEEVLLAEGFDFMDGDPQSALEVEATNAGSPDRATLSSLTIHPEAPALTAIPELQTYAARTTNPDKAAIIPIVFENTGGSVADGSCTAAELPEGLSAEVSGDTCAITGAPTEATAAKEYTITALVTTDVADSIATATRTATVTIEVLPPSDLPDFVISDSTGLTSGNFYSVQDIGADPIYSIDAANHRKVRWSTTNGITEVSHQTTNGFALLRVGRDANPSPQTTVNLGDYSEGYVVFDIRVPDYGNYPDITVKIDSIGSSNTLEVLGKIGDGRWQTVLVPVANYTARGLDLAEAIIPFSIYPNLTIQGKSEELDFMIRNIRWTNSPPAPILLDMAKQDLVVGKPITIIFENTGGSVTECNFASSDGPNGLPAGLTLSMFSGTCRIKGEPTEVTAVDEYFIRALNPTENVDVVIPIEIIAPDAPTLTTITEAQGLFLEKSATIDFANGGGPIPADGCELVTAGANPDNLPMGLILDRTPSGDACQITGKPTEEVTTPTTYTIKATNLGGMVEATVTITIIQPFTITSSSPTAGLRYEIGQTIPHAMNFTSMDGSIESCMVAPALPTWLSFGTATCAITGVPGAGITTAATTFHTITATSGEQEDSRVIAVETYLRPLLPPFFDAGVFDVRLTKGSSVGLPFLFPNQGGVPNSCGAQSNTLASLGLEYASEQDTCAIRLRSDNSTGGPKAASSFDGFFPDGMNDAGACTYTFRFDIGDTARAMPTLTAPTPSNISLNTGESVPTDFNFTTGGGEIITCVAEPALPQGLSIARDTCAIRGRTYQAQGQTPYTITATNAGGSAMASIMLTVTETSPSFADTTLDPFPHLPLEILNTGGVPQSCSVTAISPSQDLASLNLQVLAYNNTCILASLDGNALPADPTFDYSYTLTATNSAGPPSTSTLGIRNLVGFADALDIGNLVFTSSAAPIAILLRPDDPVWHSQTTTTQDEMDALQSGAIDRTINFPSAGDGNFLGPVNTTCVQTIIDTTVLGAGQLSYYDRASIDRHDNYRTYVNGSQVLNIDPNNLDSNVGWIMRTHTFTTGRSTIRWCYEKHWGGGRAASDAAWLDNFMYIPTPPQ